LMKCFLYTVSHIFKRRHKHTTDWRLLLLPLVWKKGLNSNHHVCPLQHSVIVNCFTNGQSSSFFFFLLWSMNTRNSFWR
jgi:hypothetical protein